LFSIAGVSDESCLVLTQPTKPLNLTLANFRIFPKLAVTGVCRIVTTSVKASLVEKETLHGNQGLKHF